jgi:hypothetical protein
MANGAQAQKKVQKGQLNQVDLALGDPDFCLTQPRILFDTANSFVTPDADHKRAYQSVLQRLGAGAGRLLVVGFTDDVGQPSGNDPLSERRARAALAVLTGNAGDWESIFATERWGNNEFQTMLTEVGMPVDAQSIQQHRELTSAGRARRATLFGQYFLKFLGNPTSLPTVTSLSPPSLGCGEQHVLARGDHRPSRRAEFFFFNGSSAPAVDCRLYPTWLNPCPSIPLPVPTRNAFFVSGAGDDATGDGSSAQPWRTIRHALAQIAVLRRPGQHITLNVLAGLYFENVILPSETTLESTATPKPEIRGVPFTGLPTIQIVGSRNSNVRGLKVTGGGRSGIRIDQQARNITIRGCQIADNFAPRGGGIAVIDATDVTVENNLIEQNEAGTITTAITNLFSLFPFRFEITIGDGHGGGIYLENSRDVRVRRNTIANNKAILFGGGIAVDNRPDFDGAIEISDNNIICNQVSHGTLPAFGSPVTDCTVADMGDPIRTRMLLETGTDGIRVLDFLHGVGIESGLGGGISLRHASPQTRLIRNSVGLDGKGNRARRGGGISCFVGAYPSLERNIIIGNLASVDGGGICIDQFDPFLPRSDPEIYSFRRGRLFPRQLIRFFNNRLLHNAAVEDGGGIYATGGVRLEVSGADSLFEANQAGENGGGIRVSYATRLNLDGVTFNQNQCNVDGTGQDGGGGIAARNVELFIDNCAFQGNIARNFAGAAIYFVSSFEGGFDRTRFVPNRHGQYDEIMETDFGFHKRRYEVKNCRGSNNQATGRSGAGGFLYAVRDSTFDDGSPRGGVEPIEVWLSGATTFIGQNTSEYDNPSNPGGPLQKRGNVVFELSGRRRSDGQPEDRVVITADVPTAGVARSTPAPHDLPVVVIGNDGRPDRTPPPFPFGFGAEPHILDVQPRFGPIAGNTVVLIIGQNFLAGAEVEIGGARATVTDVTETTITVTTPPGALGAFDVRVRNPDGQTDVVPGGFAYVRPPRILNVQPRSGTPAGGTPITITGTDFRPGVRVLIGGQPAANVNLISDTKITATTPPLPIPVLLGPADVRVENPDRQDDAVPGGFTYTPEMT